MTEAEEFIDRLRKEYIDNQTREQERDELLEDVNREKSDVNGYHGREIFELLQNADDAYQKSIDTGENPNEELNVTIEYKNNILKVSNTGTEFDKDGIRAIIQGNNSPKSGKYIGNKGTGFRSILNWAKKIKIFSGDFHVEFSEEIAKEEFDKIKDESQIQKQIRKRQEKGETELYLPMLAVPRNTDKYERDGKTTIEITVNPQKITDEYSVEKQLDNIDLRILMFLPNLKQIKIATEKGVIIYKAQKIKEKNNRYNCTLEKIENDQCLISEKFKLFYKEISQSVKEDDKKQDIFLSIAVPDDFSAFNAKHLYSYFPLLDTKAPFNCVMHATYILGANRNAFVKDEINNEIIKQQLDFLLETAKYYVDSNDFETAYKILIPISKYNKGYDFASFSEGEREEYYWKKILNFKMFKTVNGDIISLYEEPKLLEGGHPDCFSGKQFLKLLFHCAEDINEFIKFLADKFRINLQYNEGELRQKINQSSENWTIRQRVETFIWWNKHKYKSLPDLLKKKNGEWLKYEENCDIPDGNFGVPSWVKFSILDEEYKKELFNQAENEEKVIDARKNTKDSLAGIICRSNIFQSVKFSYRDKNGSVEIINKSVNSFENATEFVKWLWKNYGKKDVKSLMDIKDYSFPCIKNGKCLYQNSNKIFFGRNYQNDLAEKLFDESFASFPDISFFEIDKNEKEQFINFIERFGVKKYPEIKRKTLRNNEIHKKYSEFYHDKIKAYLISSGLDSNIKEINYDVHIIENLDSILSEKKTEDVLKWIYNDKELSSYLKNPDEINAKVLYKTFRQTYSREYNGCVTNYILTIFNNTKWIEIGKERYAPTEILTDSRNNKKFAEFVPCLSSLDKDYSGVGKFLNVKEMAKKAEISDSDMDDILGFFAFRKNVTDLSSQKFYEIMLKLPEFKLQKCCDLSSTINGIVEQPNFNREFEESENQKKYFDEGKILVNYEGTKQYYLAKEAYLPSSNIINKKQVPIVDKGIRTNNKHFVEVFGCKEYEKKYEINENSIKESPINEDFQKYFRDFRKYAKYYDTRNANLEKNAKNLKIILVSHISIFENGEEKDVVDEYSYIQHRKEKTKWYVKVAADRYDIYKIADVIEGIYENIVNTTGFEVNKIGELFRDTSKEGRKYLINKEFGKMACEDEANLIKANFLNVLKKVHHHTT